MTSDPRSANSIEQNGPARIRLTSSTLTPLSGRPGFCGEDGHITVTSPSLLHRRSPVTQARHPASHSMGEIHLPYHAPR
jgi:hypothetical protein